MAVKVDALKEKLEKAPLNEIELEYVALIESYIDQKLIDEYDGDYVLIDESICEFRFYPNTDWQTIPIKDTRKRLMSEVLKKKYIDAGWQILFYSTDDDGPNRPGFNYWKFEEKKGY